MYCALGNLARADTNATVVDDHQARVRSGRELSQLRRRGVVLDRYSSQLAMSAGR